MHNARQHVKGETHGSSVQNERMSIDDVIARAERLRLARAEAGFSSAHAAAQAFNWSPDTYTQHENGTRGIIRSAKKYAKAFKVSPGWLLTGEGAGPGDTASLQLVELTRVAGRMTPERQSLLLALARSMADEDAPGD